MIEYKKEAFKAFEFLNNTLKADTVEKMMRVQLVAEGMEEAHRCPSKLSNVGSCDSGTTGCNDPRWLRFR